VYAFSYSLLVEDNAGEILLIRQILSKSSFRVRLHVAVDGEQALQMLADPQFKPDLIILDLNIPKIPGLAVLENACLRHRWWFFSSSANSTEINERLNLEFASSCTNPATWMSSGRR